MKKILVTIAALFLSAAAWAQYQGTTWGSDPEFFKMQKGLTPNKKQSVYKYCTEKKLMLGQSSELFYIFENNKLSGISYAVDYSPETEKKLLDNLSGFKFKKIAEGAGPLEYNNELENILKNNSLEVLIFDDVVGTEKGKESIAGYLLNRKEKNANSRIFIYNFMEHSKIYILSNICELNKIVVVYVPQTEDF